jgi:hypothetical protein
LLFGQSLVSEDRNELFDVLLRWPVMPAAILPHSIVSNLDSEIGLAGLV